jgi:glutathione S-transferase
MAANDGTYRIFGSENSPFSVKVRSYFRYKELPHEWIVRSESNMAEYQKYAKLPLIPLVVTPDDQAIQDSTPIIEKLEAAHPAPSIHPDETLSAFASALLEEFGDEWGNKWMLHYRWAREADQVAASQRLLAEMMPSKSDAEREGMARSLSKRMQGRVWFVGSNEKTAAQIEDTWVQGIDLLEAHLKERPYVFGGRPAFADFGLWGQYYNASLDPTPGAILRDRAPATMRWVERMLEPKAEGGFEAWESLEPTLTPYLTAMCGELFLPWSEANAQGLAAEVEEYEVELAGRVWTQKPVKYQARSLAQIRKRYAAIGGDAATDAYLEATGCLRWLKE